MITSDLIKIIASEKFDKNNHVKIGLLTHSQIMNDADWEIFTRLIIELKKSGIEVIDLYRDPYFQGQIFTN